MQSKSVLVTGSSGFLGRHFVAELHRRGYKVFGVDSDDPLSLDAHSVFATKMPKYDLIIHCAAVSPNRLGIDTKPYSLIQNQRLDAAMFDWAVRTGQGRVLYFSSCAALDAEPDDYGQLKLAGERMAAQARKAGIPVTVVRPYSGYGEDQSEDFPFRAFIERAKRRDDPFEVWGDGTQVRDWIHVDDIVNGALRVVESGTLDAISLCTGKSWTMAVTAQNVCALAGYRPRFNFRPEMPAGPARRVGNPDGMYDVGYVPKVSLVEGIKRALEYKA